jgi:hypothetical protein
MVPPPTRQIGMEFRARQSVYCGRGALTPRGAALTGVSDPGYRDPECGLTVVPLLRSPVLSPCLRMRQTRGCFESGYLSPHSHDGTHPAAGVICSTVIWIGETVQSARSDTNRP